MLRYSQSGILAASCLLLVLCLISCSDSTDPVTTTGNLSEIQGEGTINPGTSTFLLNTFANNPPGGGPSENVQLIGSNLVVDPNSGMVTIDVAIGNQNNGPLFAPAVVWLSDFIPASLLVLNADLVFESIGPDLHGPLGDIHYGFDYTELFGDDGILGPQEVSEAKTWRFSSIDGSSFSFAAAIEFGMVPDLPRIAGYCWFDENRNGFPEPNEPQLQYGLVNVSFPNGQIAEAMVGPDGRYSLPVEDAGLYTLHFDPMIDTFAALGFSTPNPREVLLTSDVDGQTNSFLEGNFGMFTDVPLMQAIQFSNQTPEFLQVGSFQLLEAQLESPVSLMVKVGFSGCGPDEAFSLFMSGDFMESFPPQANIVLRKDWESDCDAVWQQQIRYDLGPLLYRYMAGYGPGILLLNLHDNSGDVLQIELAIFPPD